MPTKPKNFWKPEEDQELLDLTKTHQGRGRWGKIARQLKRTPNSVRGRYNYISNRPESESVELEPSGEGLKITGIDDNNSSLDVRSYTIRTVEDALKHAKVDTTIWRVKDYVINHWEVGMKEKDPKTGKVKAVITPLWQIKVRLERIVRKALFDGVQLLMEQLRKCPKAPIYVAPSRSNSNRLLELSLFDVHLGKLAWAQETGNDCDTGIQERIYSTAVKDLITSSRGTYDRILFPIGNDFFHVDNLNNTTAAGTQQDHDGRFPKVFAAGCRAVIEAVNACLTVAPVDVIWVPGNHDPATSFYLAMCLENRFYDNKHVHVDRSAIYRKYYQYGTNLLGFTHGSEEKFHELPMLMATERPTEWAATTWREFHIGHGHRKREFFTRDVDEFTGVRVRMLASLSGTDAWHYRKGYVQAHRAAEAFIWDKEAGYIGHLHVPARLT